MFYINLWYSRVHIDYNNTVRAAEPLAAGQAQGTWIWHDSSNVVFESVESSLSCSDSAAPHSQSLPHPHSFFYSISFSPSLTLLVSLSLTHTVHPSVSRTSKTLRIPSLLFFISSLQYSPLLFYVFKTRLQKGKESHLSLLFYHLVKWWCKYFFCNICPCLKARCAELSRCMGVMHCKHKRWTEGEWVGVHSS